MQGPLTRVITCAGLLDISPSWHAVISQLEFCGLYNMAVGGQDDLIERREAAASVACNSAPPPVMYSHTPIGQLELPSYVLYEVTQEAGVSILPSGRVCYGSEGAWAVLARGGRRRVRARRCDWRWRELSSNVKGRR